MQTLEIEVPDNKTRLVKEFLKDLGVTVKVKRSKAPNADTIAAMDELKSGKGKKFKTVDDLFKSIWAWDMFEIVTSTKFLKDLKLLKKRSDKDFKLLQQLITTLAEKGHLGLHKKHKTHKLTGNYKGYWECHVKPDLLLIWDENEQINLLELVRTGTHSDLF